MKDIQEIVNTCKKIVQLDSRINSLLAEQAALDSQDPKRTKLGLTIPRDIAKFENQIVRLSKAVHKINHMLDL